MAPEARGALAAALARVDVEELARHGDHLACSSAARKKPMPSLSGGGSAVDVAPDVERAVGRRGRCAMPSRAQAARACGRACRGRRRGSRCVSAIDVRRRRAAGWPRAAAACEPPPSRNEPALATASITCLRPDRPGHAPARVAPVLGQAVEDAPPDRGRRPRRSARRSRSAAAPARPRSRCSASRTRRSAARSRARAPIATQRAELVAADELAGRVARVRQQQRRQAAARAPRGAGPRRRTRSRARPRAGSGSAVNALKMSSSSS